MTDASPPRSPFKAGTKLARLFHAPPGETAEERRERDCKRRRALKNREAAYASRARKRQQLAHLQTRNAALEAEALELRAESASLRWQRESLLRMCPPPIAAAHASKVAAAAAAPAAAQASAVAEAAQQACPARRPSSAQPSGRARQGRVVAASPPLQPRAVPLKPSRGERTDVPTAKRTVWKRSLSAPPTPAASNCAGSFAAGGASRQLWGRETSVPAAVSAFSHLPSWRRCAPLPSTGHAPLPRRGHAPLPAGVRASLPPGHAPPQKRARLQGKPAAPTPTSFTELCARLGCPTGIPTSTTLLKTEPSRTVQSAMGAESPSGGLPWTWNEFEAL